MTGLEFFFSLSIEIIGGLVAGFLLIVVGKFFLEKLYREKDEKQDALIEGSLDADVRQDELIEGSLKADVRQDELIKDIDKKIEENIDEETQRTDRIDKLEKRIIELEKGMK